MNTSAQPLIHLDGVTKVFFTDEVETHALAGIHLEIKSGEYIAIAGPSGCGKSTLLSILGLLDSPTEGRYVLNGKQVADLPLSERARVRNREIGFIFQSFNLIGDLNVYENAPLAALGRSAAARRRRARRRRIPLHPAGGRADREPRLEERRSRDGAAPRAAPGGRDDLHGDSRPALRAPRGSLDPSLRRSRRRRGRPEEPGRREGARRERLRYALVRSSQFTVCSFRRENGATANYKL